MSIIINIENYEAFYLDFLEGNLDEEQMLAFTAFLDLHPELKLDDDLPHFQEEAVLNLSPDFISSLKTFDVWETITEENAEKFMVASVEEILPATKLVELNDFLARRKELRSDLELYKKTKLQADLELVYTEKSNLKQGVVIPLYSKWIAVAASIILIILLIPFNNSKMEASLKANTRSIPEVKSTNNIAQTVVPVLETKGENPSQTNFRNKRFKEVKSDVLVEEVTHLVPLKIASIQLVHSEEELALSPFPEKTSKHTKDENPTILAGTGMKNPAPFLTNEINKRFDTEVDLQTAKASKNKTAGFYLKIGKFEISKKVRPIEELAYN